MHDGYFDAPDLIDEIRRLLMPAQLMFGNSDVNARGSGLPLVALRSLAMQASINALAVDPRLANRASIAQILVVADERSCAYANRRSRLLRRALTEPQNQLTRIGAPSDHILLDDLHLVDVVGYRLVMFLNCYSSY